MQALFDTCYKNVTIFYLLFTKEMLRSGFAPPPDGRRGRAFCGQGALLPPTETGGWNVRLGGRALCSRGRGTGGARQERGAAPAEGGLLL